MSRQVIRDLTNGQYMHESKYLRLNEINLKTLTCAIQFIHHDINKSYGSDASNL